MDLDNRATESVAFLFGGQRFTLLPGLNTNVARAAASQAMAQHPGLVVKYKPAPTITSSALPIASAPEPASASKKKTAPKKKKAPKKK